jgi:hypothetical protein
MKQTVTLTDNYRKRLKDEICEGVSGGLRGEVEIQVRNKETGEIESTQKKNLIVYGGREWLLKKAFASNVTIDGGILDTLKNSEIMWFGVGSGGGEPGNPLQCGTTYGSDTDLYNPIRLRYELDTASSSNPNYASRIINGNPISGFYKKISYIGIKEDLANPYKVNGTVLYPNLIAEIRLEISTDDVCGQTYLETDFERSYADINEAALFIADSRVSDPGKNNLLTESSVDYYTYNSDGKRYYFKEGNVLPQYSKISTVEYAWTDVNTFPNNSVQYFDTYYKFKSTSEDYNYTENGEYYKLEKVTQIPKIFGIYNNDSLNNCIGSIKLDKTNQKIDFEFTRVNKSGGVISSLSFNIPYENKFTTDYTLDDFVFLTHGTVFVNVNKCTQFIDKDKPVSLSCVYKNGYMSDGITLLPPQYSVFEDSNIKTLMFPINFTFDKHGELIPCEDGKPFNNFSIINVTQSTDTYIDVECKYITTDENSTECRIYTDNISRVYEGLKVFNTLPEDSINHISKQNPATVSDVYKAKNAAERSYFVIDRKNGMVDQEFEDPVTFKLYSNVVNNPYTMFNRVCFSTIRLSHSREVLLLWRIYF